MTDNWKTWQPPLDAAHTLGQVRASLPGVNAADVSALVRLLENPDSPFALPGAITLDRHDAVHILLGRGLLNQDEAFVIGFTMGCATNMNRFYEFLFTRLSAALYPKPYRFNAKQLRVYQLAVQAGNDSAITNLHEFPFEDYDDISIDALRRIVGLNMAALHAAYRKEIALLPHTRASKRLAKCSSFDCKMI